MTDTNYPEAASERLLESTPFKDYPQDPDHPAFRHAVFAANVEAIYITADGDVQSILRVAGAVGAGTLLPAFKSMAESGLGDVCLREAHVEHHEIWRNCLIDALTPTLPAPRDGTRLVICRLDMTCAVRRDDISPAECAGALSLSIWADTHRPRGEVGIQELHEDVMDAAVRGTTH